MSAFSLSHGQVLWCLAGGRAPSTPLPDQVRYLRQLGIPFEASELGQGRGVRLTYGFYHYVELGVACEGLRRRVQPRFLKMLVEDRKKFRSIYRRAYLELANSPGLFEGNSGTVPMFADDYFIRLHDRYSDTPGEINMVFESIPETGQARGDLVEDYPGDASRIVIAMKPLVVRMMRLANNAPVTRPGPQG